MYCHLFSTLGIVICLKTALAALNSSVRRKGGSTSGGTQFGNLSVGVLIYLPASSPSDKDNVSVKTQVFFSIYQLNTYVESICSRIIFY